MELWSGIRIQFLQVNNNCQSNLEESVIRGDFDAIMTVRDNKSIHSSNYQGKLGTRANSIYWRNL